MSKAILQGGATGAGSVTLLAPNTASARTLTLPDSTGTVATAETTLTQFNASGSAPVYACRAWVNFNGTGAVAITASGNVSSITDNSVGDYTINFTTAMPDANYAPTTMSLSNDTSGTQAQCVIRGASATGATTMTTTALRVNTGSTSSNLFIDKFIVTIAIFR